MSEQPCIRCGECAKPCPAGVYPHLVLVALRRTDAAAAVALGLDACVACGRCDDYCPSQIALTARFTAAQTQVRQEQARREFADASRARYQAREARLERAKQAQAEARGSRRANHAAASAVAAALARAKGKDKDQGNTP